jgi:hypothetical protein
VLKNNEFFAFLWQNKDANSKKERKINIINILSKIVPSFFNSF